MGWHRGNRTVTSPRTVSRSQAGKLWAAARCIAVISLLLTTAPGVGWAAPQRAVSSPDLLPAWLLPRQTSAQTLLPDTFSSPLLPTTEPDGPPPSSSGETVTATLSPERDAIIEVNGRSTLYFPKGAVSETALVSVTALEELPAPLPRGVRYKAYGLSVEILAQSDARPITKTLRPVTVTVRYTGLPSIGNAASQQLLKLYHYDEERGAWEALPTDVAVGSGVLTATTSSFSPVVLGNGTSTTLGDYAEPWSPTVQDFQVNLFTGAATWQVPIEAPVGLGGLAPDLILGYNSAVVDEMRGKLNPQASWVGGGWNLELGYITRVITRDANLVPQAVPTYTLVLNGVRSDLVYSDTVQGQERYRMADERFWRIEHVLSGAENRADEYWMVTARDGKRYRFGYSDESAGADSYNSAWWMITPNSNGVFQYTNWRWNLDHIEDSHHNVIRIDYRQEENDFVFLWPDDDDPDTNDDATFYTHDYRPCGSGVTDCDCQLVVGGQTSTYNCHVKMAGDDHASGYTRGGSVTCLISWR